MNFVKCSQNSMVVAEADISKVVPEDGSLLGAGVGYVVGSCVGL